MWKTICYWVITLVMMATTMFSLLLGIALILDPWLWARPFLCDERMRFVIAIPLLIMGTFVYWVMNNVRPYQFLLDSDKRLRLP